MEASRTIETDVLVVGAGSTGMRAAIEAGKQEARTILARAIEPSKGESRSSWKIILRLVSKKKFWIIPSFLFIFIVLVTLAVTWGNRFN